MGYFTIHYASHFFLANVWLLMHNSITLQNLRVYMTQTISTIVDYPNSFTGNLKVYMTQTISTIVDGYGINYGTDTVYMTQTISTIVDLT